MTTTDNPLAAEDGGDWPAARAWPHVASRATYDWLAGRMLRGDSETAVRVLGALGAVASRCGWQGPRASAVRALFPHVSDRESLAIARGSTALLFRNRAAIALVAHHGLGGLASLVAERDAVAPPALARRTSGVVLIGFHVGAHFGIGAALERWGISAFSVRETSLVDTDARARALKHAVDALRAGGVVLAVADGPRGSNTPPVTCLGRRVRFRRGPFMLARATGAPLMPAVARWTSAGELRVTVDPPLVREGADVEGTLVQSAAQWLDAYLEARPEELWPYSFANFLGTRSAVEQHVAPERLDVQEPR